MACVVQDGLVAIAEALLSLLQGAPRHHFIISSSSHLGHFMSTNRLQLGLSQESPPSVQHAARQCDATSLSLPHDFSLAL